MQIIYPCQWCFEVLTSDIWLGKKILNRWNGEKHSRCNITMKRIWYHDFISQLISKLKEKHRNLWIFTHVGICIESVLFGNILYKFVCRHKFVCEHTRALTLKYWHVYTEISFYGRNRRVLRIRIGFLKSWTKASLSIWQIELVSCRSYHASLWV